MTTLAEFCQQLSTCLVECWYPRPIIELTTPGMAQAPTNHFGTDEFVKFYQMPMCKPNPKYDNIIYPVQIEMAPDLPPLIPSETDLCVVPALETDRCVVPAFEAEDIRTNSNIVVSGPNRARNVELVQSIVRQRFFESETSLNRALILTDTEKFWAETANNTGNSWSNQAHSDRITEITVEDSLDDMVPLLIETFIDNWQNNVMNCGEAVIIVDLNLNPKIIDRLEIWNRFPRINDNQNLSIIIINDQLANLEAMPFDTFDYLMLNGHNLSANLSDYWSRLTGIAGSSPVTEPVRRFFEITNDNRFLVVNAHGKSDVMCGWIEADSN